MSRSVGLDDERPYIVPSLSVVDLVRTITVRKLEVRKERKNRTIKGNVSQYKGQFLRILCIT